MFLTLGQSFLGSQYAFDGFHTQHFNRRTIPHGDTVVEPHQQSVANTATRLDVAEETTMLWARCQVMFA
jgi:hypothetical protein